MSLFRYLRDRYYFWRFSRAVKRWARAKYPPIKGLVAEGPQQGTKVIVDLIYEKRWKP
jgi:hypothetical protein